MHLPDFLIDRYKEWKKIDFHSRNKFFKLLEKKGQKPKTMIISCCDSRVDPNNIFKGKDGDFFIHRNIANLVPSLEFHKQDLSIFAALEFAVKVLNVENIVILGHSDCGGVKHAHQNLSKKNSNKNYPNINNWTNLIKPAFDLINKNKTKKDQKKELEKQSIINSISNIKKFISQKKYTSENKPKIFGLWIEISTGILMNYNKEKNKFERINY